MVAGLADMADLIEDTVVKVHPHGLLLAQVDFKHIQLAAVEAVGTLLQCLTIHLCLHCVLALPSNQLSYHMARTGNMAAEPL